MDKGQFLLYQTPDGESQIEVKLQDDTVWLSLDQMAELFQRNKSTISRHIKNVLEDGELDANMVVAFFATTTKHGAIEGRNTTSLRREPRTICRLWKSISSKTLSANKSD